ncbi:hypothetical protein TREMEDRAFT_58032 [Tremella mesenterica DSM 1558]|uniref:uncharacterized protein n=1 Tax=Tremella mesenterica (strain ATCC 24925 / CBS 8224 / DSM 1558 / NBRC 9311 / NRRL Y-6157 / RJB 2259-6 / UBC 559-6) TaxID=578456 RepID=UPI0003F49734|nr:uncharacterized protein TREMEDRAFT_58032 [Tremella mesenterica DSM 1558]EIW71900.1 hypothetical protein TREMEDRAFT_58032 [Tremella mesenterica DSM 1558]
MYDTWEVSGGVGQSSAHIAGSKSYTERYHTQRCEEYLCTLHYKDRNSTRTRAPPFTLGSDKTCRLILGITTLPMLTRFRRFLGFTLKTTELPIIVLPQDDKTLRALYEAVPPLKSYHPVTEADDLCSQLFTGVSKSHLNIDDLALGTLESYHIGFEACARLSYECWTWYKVQKYDMFLTSEIRQQCMSQVGEMGVSALGNIGRHFIWAQYNPDAAVRQESTERFQVWKSAIGTVEHCDPVTLQRLGLEQESVADWAETTRRSRRYFDKIQSNSPADNLAKQRGALQDTLISMASPLREIYIRLRWVRTVVLSFLRASHQRSMNPARFERLALSPSCLGVTSPHSDNHASHYIDEVLNSIAAFPDDKTRPHQSRLSKRQTKGHQHQLIANCRAGVANLYWGVATLDYELTSVHITKNQGSLHPETDYTTSSELEESITTNEADKTASPAACRRLGRTRWMSRGNLGALVLMDRVSSAIDVAKE